MTSRRRPVPPAPARRGACRGFARMNPDQFMLSLSKYISKNALRLLFLMLGALTAGASTITGTVRNGTTNKPSSGDDVILLRLVGGMEEETRTKTDRRGNFTLQVEVNSAPHVVRVNHQKVEYHTNLLPPGTQSVGEIAVYEAAPKVQGITGVADAMRMQTEGGILHVAEKFVLRNSSNPPRSLINNNTLEIYLPSGAEVDSSVALAPNGTMALKSAPVPQADRGHYAFVYPLRPGETQFEVEYHMPYSGSAGFAPRVRFPMEMVGVMLPKSIQFSPEQPGDYSGMMEEKGVVLRLAKDVIPPAFHISGSGTLPADALKNLSGDEASASEAADAQAPRPGGGMAVPEGTPDPIDKYRWPVLIGFVLILAGGAFWITTRQGATTPDPVTASLPGNRSNMLLEALKEELFQLESERLQQKLSAEEYEKAKTALDATLARAMRREKSNS